MGKEDNSSLHSLDCRLPWLQTHSPFGGSEKLLDFIYSHLFIFWIWQLLSSCLEWSSNNLTFSYSSCPFANRCAVNCVRSSLHVCQIPGVCLHAVSLLSVLIFVLPIGSLDVAAILSSKYTLFHGGPVHLSALLMTIPSTLTSYLLVCCAHLLRLVTTNQCEVLHEALSCPSSAFSLNSYAKFLHMNFVNL